MKGLNFGSWIPHLFYDLIGRITPGAVLLLIAPFCFLSVEGVGQLADRIFHFPASVLIILGIAVCYTIGALTGGLAYFFEKSEYVELDEKRKLGEEGQKDVIDIIRENAYPSFRNWELFLDAPKKAKWAEVMTYYPRPSEPYIYDFLLANHADIGARLAKLSAERHMCRSMMVGAFLLLVGRNIYFLGQSFNWWMPFLAVVFYFIVVFVLNKRPKDTSASQPAIQSKARKRFRKSKNLIQLGALILLIVLFPLVYYPYGFKSEFSFWALQILLFIIVFASVVLRKHLRVRSRNLMVSNYSIVWDLQKESSLKQAN